jgi:alpha-glucosidase
MSSLANMQLDNGIALGVNNGIASSRVQSIHSQIINPILERKMIPDVYNELTITLKQSFTVLFRTYNDGVAYRIVTRFKDSIIVKGKTANLNFPQNHPVYFPQTGKRDNADVLL